MTASYKVITNRANKTVIETVTLNCNSMPPLCKNYHHSLVDREIQ